MKCKATKADGTPCQTPEAMVDPDTGLCHAHEPGGAERMTELARKGAHAKHEKDRRGGLDPRELGPLETHEDAKRWIRLIGEAVVTKRLAHQDARTGIRAVEAWLKARAEESTREVVDELKAELERLKKQQRSSLRSVS